jgi:hypothetical protein
MHASTLSASQPKKKKKGKKGKREKGNRKKKKKKKKEKPGAILWIIELGQSSLKTATIVLQPCI